jgi:hypothetical protein
MIEGKLWRARKQGVEKVQQWRPRRSRFGELVQWDTSDRDWLEGRGDPMLLINRIDDATSRWFMRLVPSDPTVENMNVLEQYMKKPGRPLAVYTDQAALFKTAQKTKAGESVAVGDRSELPDQKRRRVVSLVQDKVSHGSAPVASRSAGPCMWGSCGFRHTVRRPKGAWNGDWLRLRIGW